MVHSGPLCWSRWFPIVIDLCLFLIQHRRSVWSFSNSIYVDSFSACICSVLTAFSRRRRPRLRAARAVTAAVTNRLCGQFRFRRVCLALPMAIHCPSAPDGCTRRRASQGTWTEAGRNGAIFDFCTVRHLQGVKSRVTGLIYRQ